MSKKLVWKFIAEFFRLIAAVLAGMGGAAVS